jgi:hypothetical protein
MCKVTHLSKKVCIIMRVGAANREFAFLKFFDILYSSYVKRCTSVCQEIIFNYVG